MLKSYEIVTIEEFLDTGAIRVEVEVVDDETDIPTLSTVLGAKHFTEEMTDDEKLAKVDELVDVEIKRYHEKVAPKMKSKGVEREVKVLTKKEKVKKPGEM